VLTTRAYMINATARHPLSERPPLPVTLPKGLPSTKQSMYTTKLTDDNRKSVQAKQTNACIIVLGYFSWELNKNSQITTKEQRSPHALSHSEMLQKARVSSVLATAKTHNLHSSCITPASFASSVPSSHLQRPEIESQVAYGPLHGCKKLHGVNRSLQARVTSMGFTGTAYTSVHEQSTSPGAHCA